MKNVSIIAVVFGLILSSTAFAQNIENVKKETTVKTVTVKDTDVQTIVEKEVTEEVAVIQVEGTNKVDQSSDRVVVKDAESISVDVVDEGLNKENQAKLEKQQKEERARLEKQQKEEYGRIDSQQRGVPIKTEQEDVRVTPIKKDKKQMTRSEKREDRKQQRIKKRKG